MADGPSEIDELLDELLREKPTTRVRPPASDAGQPETPPEQHGARDRDRLRVLVPLGIAALLVVGGAIGWAVGKGTGSGDGDEEATINAGTLTAADDADEDRDSTASAAGASDDPSTGDATDGDPASASTATTTDRSLDTSTSTADDFVVPETDDNPFGASQYIVMSKGRAIFRGWYPAQEAVDDALATAVAVMGPDNVVDETVIEPRAELDPDGFAVYYEDYVLFEPGSDELADDFYPLLDPLAAAMLADPTIQVTIVARTDARGPAADNLELSRRRAQAVADHVASRGVDPARLLLDPRGELDAVQDPDDDEARLDRRVELVASGAPFGG